MNYIDCHNHVLWNVDDGLQLVEETHVALQQASKDGFVALCVTPHVIPGKTTNEHVRKIKDKFELFKAIADQYNIAAFLGCELKMNYEMMQAIDNDIVIPMNNSRYILTEFSLTRDVTTIEYIDEYLLDLVDRGYTPIIAHVERYFPKGVDLKQVQKWVNYGCVIQINRTSLLGMYGKILKTNCEKLLKNKLVSLVCSDAHSISGSRVLKLSDTYNILCSIVGIYNAGILLYENPLNIINDIDTVLMR